jgi:F-type H+-transporting ATPase subunit a
MTRPTTLGTSGIVLVLSIVLTFTIGLFGNAFAQHEEHAGDLHETVDNHEADAAHEIHNEGIIEEEHAADPHSDAAHDPHGAASHGEGHHPEGSKIPELPNLIGVFHHLFPGAFAPLEQFAESAGFADPMGTPFTALENVIFMLLAIIGLSWFFIAAYKRLKVQPVQGQRISRRATFVEIVVLYFEDFFGAILGREHVRQHLPLVGALFIYILVLNSMGLLFLGKAPTANLSFNMGMAVIVFLYVHIFAIRKSPMGYLAHYPGNYPSVKELGMGPLGAALVGFIIILFSIIHVMEAVIQPVSLSLRLFGNLLGKDVLLGVFGDLIPWVPLHTPFLFLGLLLGAIQALIFSLLTAVYITLWQPHEHHHAEHGEGHGHGSAHKPESLHPEPVHAKAA